MIVQMAVAEQNFLNMKTTPTEPTNLDDYYDFEKSLKCFLDFENVDLLGFDGITGTMESKQNPTNSIFFFENDTGKFLYQIMSSSPITHKNKLLWNISVQQIEDLEKFNFLHNQTIDWVGSVKKSIPTTTNKFNSVVNKGNFSRLKQNIFPFPLTEKDGDVCSFYTLKLKFSVMPLIGDNEGLPANETDGSYSFLFPFTLGANMQIHSDRENKTIALEDILSKYSTNLKSIEVLPFLANEHNGVRFNANVDITVQHNWINITDTLTGGYSIVVTNAGIYTFYKLTGSKQKAVSKYKTDGTKYLDIFGKQIGMEQYYPHYFNKKLNIGGGARGFLRTPLANIPIDFNIQNDNDNEPDSLFFVLKEDGFVIQGAFNVIVPPHYINFYTDSSGSIFYANVTTNALAFRNLERDKVAQSEKATTNFFSGLISGAVQTEIGALSGNAFSVAGGLQSLVGGATDLIVGNQQRQKDYDKSKAELEDKIKTESLLAEYTGKQVLGSVSIGDFFESVNGAYFCIFIETNYFARTKQNNSIIFATQEDYDFAVPEDNQTTSADIYTYLKNNIFKTTETSPGQYGIVFSLRIIDSFGYLGNIAKMTNNLYLPIRYNV